MLEGLTWVPVPWNLLGLLVMVAALIPLRLGARSPWVRLGAVALTWLGLVIVSPWLLILAVPPAIIVVNRRRRLLLSQQLVSVERSTPSLDMAAEVAAYTAYGYRHAATLSVTDQDGTYPIEIHRTADSTGWIELTSTTTEIQHRFGTHSFSTAAFQSSTGHPMHLIQVCADERFEPRMIAHRRVLARLARLGHRPDRLTDDEVVSFLTAQIHRSYRRMAQARWRDATAHTYWEEKAYQGRIGCEHLADRPDFDRILTEWLATPPN